MPIASVTAFARFIVQNPKSFAAQPNGDGNVAKLIFFNSADTNDTELIMVAKEMKMAWIDAPYLRDVFIQFRSGTSIDIGRLRNQGRHERVPLPFIDKNVDFVNHLDSAYLEVFAGPINEIYPGNAVIFLNNVSKGFLINPKSTTNNPIIFSSSAKSPWISH